MQQLCACRGHARGAEPEQSGGDRGRERGAELQGDARHVAGRSLPVVLQPEADQLPAGRRPLRIHPNSKSKSKSKSKTKSKFIILAMVLSVCLSPSVVLCSSSSICLYECSSVLFIVFFFFSFI